MKQIYQSIWIELPYPVVQVVDVNMTEGMNCHACMQITAICEDEKQEELLNQSVEHKIVQAGFLKEGAEKESFFTGRISEAVLTYEKGQMTDDSKTDSAVHDPRMGYYQATQDVSEYRYYL